VIDAARWLVEGIVCRCRAGAGSGYLRDRDSHVGSGLDASRQMQGHILYRNSI
jgi:hypothetical protein